MKQMNAHVTAYSIRGVIRNCNNIVDTSRKMAENAVAIGKQIDATVDRMEERSQLFCAAMRAMRENRMDDYYQLKAEWQAIPV